MSAGELRVMQVIGSLGPGGAERWAIELAETLDGAGVASLVCVAEGTSRLFSPGVPVVEARPGKLRLALDILRRARENRIDLIHAHLNYYSAILVVLGRLAGLKVVVSWHNDLRAFEAGAGLARRLYYRLARQVILLGAAKVVPVSDRAMLSFAAGLLPQRRIATRCARVYCGIRVAGPDGETPEARPAGGPTVGMLGRLVAQKNLDFALDIANAAGSAGMRFEIYGSGPLADTLARAIATRGRHGNVTLHAPVPDVQTLLRRRIDVLLMTSLHEGLPLTALEAQSAGVPCVLSDAITRECVALPRLVRFLGLSEGPTRWSAEIRAAAATRLDSREAAAEFGRTDFVIARSAARIAELYRAAS